MEGCFPSTNDNENAFTLVTVGKSEGTAGIVSNSRGSVSAFLVSASTIPSSRTVNFDRLSVTDSVISGSGLSDAVEGSGFSKSSGGLLINIHTGYGGDLGECSPV